MRFFLPFLALVGLAITAPGWTHWIGLLDESPSHIQFLGGLILPFIVLLLGASWLEPGRN
jgi:hypothetical protein